ncbi:MAG: hypothetical protein JRJ47_03095 [Deltaproteobacteria bacterium]|nr:hypothetical protein [Deltaproteobacteria bacterium]
MASMKPNMVYQGNPAISVETLPECSHPLVVKKPSKLHPSRIMFLPKVILTLLMALLAFVSSHVCSTASAEEQAVMNARTERTDQTVMAVLIERIEAHAPDTAKGLQSLVDDFQFEPIRDLLGDVM